MPAKRPISDNVSTASIANKAQRSANESASPPKHRQTRQRANKRPSDQASKQPLKKVATDNEKNMFKALPVEIISDHIIADMEVFGSLLMLQSNSSEVRLSLSIDNWIQNYIPEASPFHAAITEKHKQLKQKYPIKVVDDTGKVKIDNDKTVPAMFGYWLKKLASVIKEIENEYKGYKSKHVLSDGTASIDQLCLLVSNAEGLNFQHTEKGEFTEREKLDFKVLYLLGKQSPLTSIEKDKFFSESINVQRPIKRLVPMPATGRSRTDDIKKYSCFMGLYYFRLHHSLTLLFKIAPKRDYFSIHQKVSKLNPLLLAWVSPAHTDEIISDKFFVAGELIGQEYASDIAQLIHNLDCSLETVVKKNVSYLRKKWYEDLTSKIKLKKSNDWKEDLESFTFFLLSQELEFLNSFISTFGEDIDGKVITNILSSPKPVLRILTACQDVAFLNDFISIKSDIDTLAVFASIFIDPIHVHIHEPLLKAIIKNLPISKTIKIIEKAIEKLSAFASYTVEVPEFVDFLLSAWDLLLEDIYSNEQNFFTLLSISLKLPESEDGIWRRVLEKIKPSAQEINRFRYIKESSSGHDLLFPILNFLIQDNCQEGRNIEKKIKLLLECGISCNDFVEEKIIDQAVIKTKHHSVALFQLASGENITIKKIEANLTIVNLIKLLIACGADINLTINNQTMLDYAAKNENKHSFPMIKEIYDRYASPDNKKLDNVNLISAEKTCRSFHEAIRAVKTNKEQFNALKIINSYSNLSSCFDTVFQSKNQDEMLLILIQDCLAALYFTPHNLWLVYIQGSPVEINAELQFRELMGKKILPELIQIYTKISEDKDRSEVLEFRRAVLLNEAIDLEAAKGIVSKLIKSQQADLLKELCLDMIQNFNIDLLEMVFNLEMPKKILTALKKSVLASVTFPSDCISLNMKKICQLLGAKFFVSKKAVTDFCKAFFETFDKIEQSAQKDQSLSSQQRQDIINEKLKADAIQQWITQLMEDKELCSLLFAGDADGKKFGDFEARVFYKFKNTELAREVIMFLAKHNFLWGNTGAQMAELLKSITNVKARLPLIKVAFLECGKNRPEFFNPLDNKFSELSQRDGSRDCTTYKLRQALNLIYVSGYKAMLAILNAETMGKAKQFITEQINYESEIIGKLDKKDDSLPDQIEQLKRYGSIVLFLKNAITKNILGRDVLTDETVSSLKQAVREYLEETPNKSDLLMALKNAMEEVTTNQASSQDDNVDDNESAAFYYAYIGEEKKYFTVQEIEGNGDCGFQGLFVTRQAICDFLLSLQDEKKIRDEIKIPILAAIMTGEITASEQVEAWKSQIAKLDADENAYTVSHSEKSEEERNAHHKLIESEREEILEKMREYCGSVEAFTNYAREYISPNRLWLDKISMKLYAQYNGIRLYILDKQKDSQELKFDSEHSVTNNQQMTNAETIYLVFNGMHFDFLILSKKPAVEAKALQFKDQSEQPKLITNGSLFKHEYHIQRREKEERGQKSSLFLKQFTHPISPTRKEIDLNETFIFSLAGEKALREELQKRYPDDKDKCAKALGFYHAIKFCQQRRQRGASLDLRNLSKAELMLINLMDKLFVDFDKTRDVSKMVDYLFEALLLIGPRFEFLTSSFETTFKSYFDQLETNFIQLFFYAANQYKSVEGFHARRLEKMEKLDKQGFGYIERLEAEASKKPSKAADPAEITDKDFFEAILKTDYFKNNKALTMFLKRVQEYYQAKYDEFFPSFEYQVMDEKKDASEKSIQKPSTSSQPLYITAIKVTRTCYPLFLASQKLSGVKQGNFRDIIDNINDLWAKLYMRAVDAAATSGHLKQVELKHNILDILETFLSWKQQYQQEVNSSSNFSDKMLTSLKSMITKVLACPGFDELDSNAQEIKQALQKTLEIFDSCLLNNQEQQAAAAESLYLKPVVSC